MVVAWIITGAVIVVVAVVVLAITALAARIASVAMDAIHSVDTTRDRTSALWNIATTNRVAEQILEAAVKARGGLGGDVGDVDIGRGRQTPEEIFGDSPQVAEKAVQDSLPTGPQIDPEESR